MSVQAPFGMPEYDGGERFDLRVRRVALRHCILAMTWQGGAAVPRLFLPGQRGIHRACLKQQEPSLSCDGSKEQLRQVCSAALP